MSQPRTFEQDLERLRRRAERVHRAIVQVDLLPDLALEAVADLEQSMRNFAFRWIDDMSVEQRQAVGAAFDGWEELNAEVERLVANVRAQRGEG